MPGQQGTYGELRVEAAVSDHKGHRHTHPSSLGSNVHHSCVRPWSTPSRSELCAECCGGSGGHSHGPWSHGVEGLTKESSKKNFKNSTLQIAVSVANKARAGFENI